jgi:hypothetical protein
VCSTTISLSDSLKSASQNEKAAGDSHLDSNGRLEPVPILGQHLHDRNGHVQARRERLRDVVARTFSRRIENPDPMPFIQARRVASHGPVLVGDLLSRRRHISASWDRGHTSAPRGLSRSVERIADVGSMQLARPCHPKPVVVTG